jgi:transcriptional regulator with XRE-family HTH domain
MGTFGIRLQKVLQHYEITAYKLGKDIDFSNAAIGNMLSGKTSPSYDFLSKLMELFPLLNGNWLLMNRGDMFIDPNMKVKNNTYHSPDLIEAKNEIIALLNEHVKMKDQIIHQLKDELKETHAANKLLEAKNGEISKKLLK